MSDFYSIDPDSTLNIAAPGVLVNDSDINGDSLTAVLVSDVSHGNLTLDSDGSFVYTPDEGYTGFDSFYYWANDGQENSNTASVTINIVSADGGGGSNDVGSGLGGDGVIIIRYPG